MANNNKSHNLSTSLREIAWSGHHPGDSLYGLRPLPADLAIKLLILAANIEESYDE